MLRMKKRDVPGDASDVNSETRSLSDEYDELELPAPSESDPLSSVDP